MKQIKRFLLITIIQVLFVQAFSQDFWEMVTTGIDSTFSWCMHISSEGDIYLGMRGWDYPGGIYRSTDNAQTWEYLGLTERPVYGIEVCSNGDIIAGVHSAIYKSSDNGQSWYEVNFDATNFKDFLSLPNGYVFSGESSDIYGSIIRSTDFGETWQTNYVFPNLEENVNAFTVTLNGDIYVGTYSMFTSDGLYVTHDFGESWEAIDFPGAAVYSVAVHPSGDIFVGCLGNGLYRYYHNAGQWVHEFFNVTPDDILFVGNDKIFIGLNGSPISMYGIFYSDDGGIIYEWLNSGMNGGDGTVINYLFRHPNNKIYAEGAGLYRSVEPVYTNLYDNKKTEIIFTYNFPNPVTNITTFIITTSSGIVGDAVIKIFNTQGQLIEKIKTGITLTGETKINYNAGHLPAGAYYYHTFINKQKFSAFFIKH